MKKCFYFGSSAIIAVVACGVPSGIVYQTSQAIAAHAEAGSQAQFTAGTVVYLNNVIKYDNGLPWLGTNI